MIENKPPRFRGSVLVCEDNEINQEVLLEHLSRVGLSADVADNGAMGVEMAKAGLEEGHPYDLILMDVNMPVMSGLDAARALRELGNPSPVVAITADAMTGSRETYAEAGIADFVTKPFSAQSLWACLRRFLTETEHGGGHDTSTVLIPRAARVDYALGLEQAADNAQLYARLRRDFVTGQEGAVRGIREDLKSGKIDEAILRTHTLKGVARMIGAGELADRAAAVEAALRGGADAAALLDELKEELEAVVEELRLDSR